MASESDADYSSKYLQVGKINNNFKTGKHTFSSKCLSKLTFLKLLFQIVFGCSMFKEDKWKSDIHFFAVQVC